VHECLERRRVVVHAKPSQQILVRVCSATAVGIARRGKTSAGGTVVGASAVIGIV
jgi:hypothetical protein